MLGQKKQVNLIYFYSLSAIILFYAFTKKLVMCNYYKGSMFASHQLKEKEGIRVSMSL